MLDVDSIPVKPHVYHWPSLYSDSYTITFRQAQISDTTKSGQTMPVPNQ